jgi:thiamine transport system substrate-binding protein
VQSALPESMYVFPVMPDATIPPDWAKFAPQPDEPYEVAPEEIAAQREQWLTEWTDVVSR